MASPSNGDSPGDKNNENPYLFFQRWVGVIVVLSMVAMYVFSTEEEAMRGNGGVEKKVGTAHCASFCTARHKQRIHHHGGDYLDTTYLLNSVRAAHQRLIYSLKRDYGDEYYETIFMENGVPRSKTVWRSAGGGDISQKRFQRKLQMKILRMQMGLLEQEQNLEGCNCIRHYQETNNNAPNETKTSRRHRRLGDNPVVLPPLQEFYSGFVWSTGGHSAAAGHGNLYNESYTAFMERAAMDVFASVGMHFEGRNYAMGGMDSSPEIALCNEAIFGVDADVISWDFGMLDGRAYWKKLVYASRTGMHRNRPMHVSINVDGRGADQRVNQIKMVEEAGLAAMFLMLGFWSVVAPGIPDMLGMSADQIAKVPPFARDFKCNDVIEKGVPTCDAQKYSKDICPNRKFRASWHPGWHYNALYGNFMALLLADNLVEAIEGLSSNTSSDPTDLYNKLKKEEDADYQRFFKRTVPENAVPTELSAVPAVATRIFHNRAICHTALLPAQSRYLGILTESPNKTFANFDKGLPQTEADQQPPPQADQGPMRLVHNGEHDQKCEVPLAVDHKDFFYTNHKDGWTSLTLPNDAEAAFFYDDGFKPLGIVLICFVRCDWGKCPRGDMQHKEFAEGNLKLEVNGNVVRNLTHISGCHALTGEKGQLVFAPNEKGRFVLRARVVNPGSYTRITSAILL